MKVIWVLENIKEDFSFYGKFNILLLLASVKLWKKHYPEDRCYLYCDKLTEAVLYKANALDFFDVVEQYTHDREIDRNVFWAANKVAVLGKQEEPVILMDNDTLCFRPIKQYLDPDAITVYNLEVGKGYYPGNADKYVKKLSYKPRWQTDSVNVSFLHLPDPKFTQEYSKLSLQIMEEFTKAKAPNSQYLIFAEQLVLRHMIDRDKIKLRSLQSTYWNCDEWDFGKEHDLGIWSWPEVEMYAKHYGPSKRDVLASNGDYEYDLEIEMLLNCINFPKLNIDFIEKK